MGTCLYPWVSTTITSWSPIHYGVLPSFALFVNLGIKRFSWVNLRLRLLAGLQHRTPHIITHFNIAQLLVTIWRQSHNVAPLEAGNILNWTMLQATLLKHQPQLLFDRQIGVKRQATQLFNKHNIHVDLNLLEGNKSELDIWSIIEAKIHGCLIEVSSIAYTCVQIKAKWCFNLTTSVRPTRRAYSVRVPDWGGGEYILCP